MITQTPIRNPLPTREELEFPKKKRITGMQICLWMIVVAGFVGVAAFIGIMRLKSELKVPNAVLPTLQAADQGVQFFDRNNHYLCTVHADRDRQPVPLAKISKNVRTALLAAEDHHFYEHRGIDFIGVARAFNKNRTAGRIVEGGSTITQQLVRNLYLDKNDRSYNRKIKEVFLSFDAESRYTKAKILETYLNEVYFGGGVYGVERAANIYFNKHASQLSLGESAFIAGLIKSPSVYGNPANRKLALARHNEVLDKMAEYGYITTAQAESLKGEKLAFKQSPNPLKYPYYVSYALQAVSREMGDDMWKQTLKVYTNLDPDAQNAAQAVLNKGIKGAPKGVNQGALVSMNVHDGAVLAMVGGVGSYRDNQWNRALFPHTAGSSFKPFVYLTGLIKGVLEPDTLIDDSPLSITSKYSAPWTPKNFDGKFKGWITVRDALTYSRNICAVRVALETGITPIIETARAAGINAKMDPYPSLALGACAVSPLEMATAYGTLARNGVYMRPQMLRSIQTTDGKTIKKFAGTPSANLPANAVAQLVDIMQDVVKRGTGTQAALPGIAVAGKTGTADGARDIWFCGFTPDTVTTVWGGSDLNQAIRGNNVTGGTVMAHIWREYMTAYYAKHKPTAVAFAAPETRLATSFPKYDQATLLTTDVTKEDVSLNGGKVTKSQEKVALNPAQVIANIPVLIYNSSTASEKGIGKAFVVQAGNAAKRWQASEIDHIRQAQGQPMQPQAQAQPQARSQVQVTPQFATMARAVQTLVEQPAQAATRQVTPLTPVRNAEVEYKAAPDYQRTSAPVMVEQYLGNQKVVTSTDQSSM